MKVWDIIRIAGRIFKHNRLRTFLTILGISVGIGTIVFLVSLGYGLQKITIDKIANLEALTALEVKPTGGEHSKPVTLETKEQIEEMPEVVYAEPVFALTGQIKFKDAPGDVAVYGIGDKYFVLEGMTFGAGQAIGSTEVDQIVVTSAVLEQFSQDTTKLPPDKVKLSYFLAPQGEGTTVLKDDAREYQIVGVVIDEFQASVFMPYQVVQEQSDKLAIDSLKIQVKNQGQIAGAREKISGMGYVANTVIDTIEELEKGFTVIRFFLGLLGFIALLVASIGMFNTMTIALLERIKEVGIMKAIGAADRDIWSIFLAEAVLIGLFGGGGGIVVGFSAASLVNSVFNGLARAYEGQEVELFAYPIWFLVSIVIFSCLVSFVTGVYPARRAAKLNPLQALRYE